MAGELQVSMSITANKTGGPTNFASGSNYQADMAGKYAEKTIQTFTTTPTAIRIGSTTNVGYVVLKHQGNANNLLVRAGSGGADVVGVTPGNGAMFQSATNTLFGSASSGTIDVEVTTFEA